jgi:ankyrin repeat protein
MSTCGIEMGRPHFDVACRNGKREIATFLAEFMGIEVEVVDCWIGRGVTTMEVASQNAGSYVVESSPSCGENVNDLVNEGTSLHTGSDEGSLDTVRSLLAHGADVNERDELILTPLHRASWKGRLAVAKFLIQHGADVNTRNKLGSTSLHIASRFGHPDIVRLLPDEGANINAKARDLWTPLHFASADNHLEVVKLLLERGANVHVQSEEGWTPSQLALITGRKWEIIQLLSEYGAH